MNPASRHPNVLEYIDISREVIPTRFRGRRTHTPIFGHRGTNVPLSEGDSYWNPNTIAVTRPRTVF